MSIPTRRGARKVIAIINTNDDLVLALRGCLLDEGYAIVMAHIRDIKTGREDFGKFVTAHRPAAIIYDVPLPYDDNWTFLNTLRKLPEVDGTPVLVTTVNKRAMDERVGPTESIELVGGHADDFEPLIDALGKALKRS